MAVQGLAHGTVKASAVGSGLFELNVDCPVCGQVHTYYKARMFQPYPHIECKDAARYGHTIVLEVNISEGAEIDLL